MKRQIRRGVFETNSSSTHSLTILMKADYVRWKSEELYLYDNSGYGWELRAPVENTLYTRDEAAEFVKKNKYYKNVDEVDDEILHDCGFISWDAWGNGDLESFYQEFTTPSGEAVVAFGEFGYDN